MSSTPPWWRRALGEEAALVEERLEEIERVHGLIRLVREHEFPDRTMSRRYAFVHAVYQDALSSGLAPARRAAVCRASADALLAFQNGQPGLAAAELALLYEAGREFGRAADLFHAAAQNAARVFAHRESAALARRGLALLRGLPETPEHAAREFRLADDSGAPAADHRGVRGAGHGGGIRPGPCGVGGNAVGGPAVPDPLGAVARLQGPLGPRPGTSPGRRVVDPGRAVRRSRAVLLARQAGAIVALCAGDPTAACAHAEAGARLYDPDRHRNLTFQFGQDPGVACLAFGAVALWLTGDEREAVARSRDAVRLAREGSQPSTVALALHFAAMLHQFRGDPAAVRELAAEALAISVEHRFAFWQAGATVMLGWAAAASGANEAHGGKWRGAISDGPAVLDRGSEAWHATGSLTYRTYSLTLLADALRRCGRPQEALAVLDKAERAMEETAERLCEPELHRLRGELLSDSRPDVAEKAFRAAIAAAESQRARALQLRAAIGFGRFLRDRGRSDEARDVVAIAVDQFNGRSELGELREAQAFLRN